MSKNCFLYCAGVYSEGYLIPADNDFIVAVDGGYEYAQKLGVKPQLAVGDFDSLGYVPENIEVICHPAVKDDTDTVLAVKLMLERGYDCFYIFGAFGGRLDHSYANLQLLTYIARQNIKAFAFDENYVYTAIHNSTITFDKSYEGVISSFAVGELANGVSMNNLKYTLCNATLYCDNPMGVSNEFIGENATISVSDGTLLIMFERKSALALPCIK